VGLRASHAVEHRRWILGQCSAMPCDALIWPHEDQIAFIDRPGMGVANVDHVQGKAALAGSDFYWPRIYVGEA